MNGMKYDLVTYLEKYAKSESQKLALRLGDWKEDKMLSYEELDNSIILNFEKAGRVVVDLKRTQVISVFKEDLFERMTCDIYDHSHPNGSISLTYII